MKKFDWKSRLSNKTFWVTAIPGGLLLIQAILACFGITWDYTKINENLIAVVNAAFAFLTALGIVINPITSGITDTDGTESETDDDAATLGENYNTENADDTQPDEITATPEIENEKIIETVDEGLTGNDLGTTK